MRLRGAQPRLGGGRCVGGLHVTPIVQQLLPTERLLQILVARFHARNFCCTGRATTTWHRPLTHITGRKMRSFECTHCLIIHPDSAPAPLVPHCHWPAHCHHAYTRCPHACTLSPFVSGDAGGGGIRFSTGLHFVPESDIIKMPHPLHTSNSKSHTPHAVSVPGRQARATSSSTRRR